ncbi:hypothetical protein [Desulfomonile tiedjei]|uniref:Nucleotidyltransferase n=1 Tax=Desulfomonile tiedjei (strain ATCC 49306 / DSM 6799 / DCB-1) TaxID=706587 RepID=I4C982_DESTA|nr:hypothetical protein [Desulfomonile tiedjei]AFM26123.1 hypothetical protein Desti_3472 [Desulfomonile tiedjei DSM 6799]
MATSVTSAFNQFMQNVVNLDPEETKSARKSRDWLVKQIRSFPEAEGSFPRLYSEKDIFFGSFARMTKIRPLDDIDMMICLHAQGSVYAESWGHCDITIRSAGSNLGPLCNDGTFTLNSRKVINKFVSHLSSVPQYKNAAIKRNLEAAVLNLTSYMWSFDIVPCFFTEPDAWGRTYYLIPDGNGAWKKSDPRNDRDRVTRVNQTHKGNILNVIRIMKYWNRRPTMPSMASYLLETMIVDHYDNVWCSEASSYVDLEIPKVLAHIANSLFSSVNDPTGVQGDINTLSHQDRQKIWSRANYDHQRALEARQLEDQGNQHASIAKWGEIFGSSFPDYG